MGWTFFHRDPGLTTREVLEHELPTSLTVNGRILESRMVPGIDGETVFYAAVKGGTNDPNEVWALVVLTKWAGGYYNWGYKDMDETMGPGECECPTRILDLLTPTDNEYANGWRKDCRENAEKTARRKALIKSLAVGDVVTLIPGCKVGKLVIVSLSPLQGRGEDGRRYKVPVKLVSRVEER